MDTTTARTPSAAAGRLAASPVNDDPSFLLARANALSLAANNAAIADLGLRVRSYSVLAVAAADVRPSQKELAEFLRLDPSQVVALVDELQTRDLVVREPDQTDRRAKVVVATDEGRRLAAQAAVATRTAQATLHGHLSEDERDELARLLRLIAFPP